MLSAQLFGFSGVSILLPSAAAGVLSVLLLYHLVARSFGSGAGLLAAAAMAVMPVAVADNRSINIDSILVLFLLLAAWAVSIAAERGSLRLLLVGAVLVGLGFNVKMLEAYLAVPALGVVYLLGAPRRVWTRIWHLLAAAAVLLIMSLSWAITVDQTPASQRPWVDSTTTNSELDLAIHYNGLQRLLGRSGSGGPGGGSGGGGFGGGGNGVAGPLRLLNQQLGGQIGWLLLLAFLGIVAALLRYCFRSAADSQDRAALLWGTWLLTTVAFFSVAGFYHSYYLVTVAPAIAALTGIAISLFWREYARRNWRGWLLPVALLASAAIQLQLLTPYPDWSSWLTPTVLAMSLASTGCLVLGQFWRSARIWTPIAVCLGALVLLAAPTAWSVDTTISGGGGMIPTAGPSASSAGGFGGGSFRVGFGGGVRVDDAGLVNYLEQHQGRAKYLLAVQNSTSAAPYIIQTGKAVLSLGGFGGRDPILTLSQLQTMVKNGTVRFFSSFGGYGGFGGSDSIAEWVQSACQSVPESDYEGDGSNSYGGYGQQLYDCAGAY